MLPLPAREDLFGKALAAHQQATLSVSSQQPVLTEIAQAMTACLRSGGQILWCGNGGSAAHAQHLAAEIVGRFRRERRGLPSIALTADTAILTAIANDYGYETVFSRQVEALGRPGDLFVAISTSGSSPNILHALETASALGLTTVAFTGQSAPAIRAYHHFAVDSRDPARIQEAHLLAGHILCDWLEAAWVASEEEAALRVIA